MARGKTTGRAERSIADLKAQPSRSDLDQKDDHPPTRRVHIFRAALQNHTRPRARHGCGLPIDRLLPSASAVTTPLR